MGFTQRPIRTLSILSTRLREANPVGREQRQQRRQWTAVTRELATNGKLRSRPVVSPAKMAAEIAFIDGDAVRKLLTWEPLMDKISDAMRGFSERTVTGSVIQPVRQSVVIPKHDGWLGLMPAAITDKNGDDDVMATKLVTLYPKNVELGIPTHHSVVVLFDCSTGSVKAVLDGKVITEMRTAATSAVAVQHLARRKRVFAVLGAGVQARSHVNAFLHKFEEIEEVRMWHYKKDGAARLASELRTSHPGRVIDTRETADDAVDGADIILTATTASKPFLHGRKIKEGALIVAVGAPKPDWQELDPDLVRSSLVIADSRDGALKESGDIIHSKAEVYGELGEIIAGSKPIPSDENRRIIFKSLGMAIQDAVAAELVYKEYVRMKK